MKATAPDYAWPMSWDGLFVSNRIESVTATASPTQRPSAQKRKVERQRGGTRGWCIPPTMAHRMTHLTNDPPFASRTCRIATCR